jgi:hypothetical protein
MQPLQAGCTPSHCQLELMLYTHTIHKSMKGLTHPDLPAFTESACGIQLAHSQLNLGTRHVVYGAQYVAYLGERTGNVRVRRNGFCGAINNKLELSQL